jgi:putative ABC transport system substrate-binding protein
MQTLPTLARERPDGFLGSRSVELATLAARDRIPAIYSNRRTVAIGGLMSYGANATDNYRQVGVYVLKGAKPADLPVVQSTKFVVRHQPANRKTARPRGAAWSLAIADEIIE